MKAFLLLVFLLTVTHFSFGQAVYKGFIDTYPIELVLYADSKEEYFANYVYTKYDEPISMSGKLANGTITLNEKDKSGKKEASFIFQNFDLKSQTLIGFWKDLTNKKELKITLNKIFDFEEFKATGAKKQEILQGASIGKKYFKLVVNTVEESDFMRVSAVRVYEKKTDKLLQEFDVDCQFRAQNGFAIEDYNFDGKKDFSVFEDGYAGSNTSSIYFLLNPTNDTFFRSEIAGTSLEFDRKAKRIIERNQCCAGTEIQTETYKLVNNKMVSVSKICLKLNEKGTDYIKVKCE